MVTSAMKLHQADAADNDCPGKYRANVLVTRAKVLRYNASTCANYCTKVLALAKYSHDALKRIRGRR
jgi:hypothetical protein